MAALMEIENLSIQFHTEQGIVYAVRGLSLALNAGETLALVGESGCGKTVFCKSLLGMLPARGAVAGGSIRLDGRELCRCTEREWNQIRGRDISMVFQNPLGALDPTVPLGKMIADSARIHQRMSRREAKSRALKMMEQVGFDDPAERFRQYPGQLSGGMRQRAVIAAALVQNPRILVADEPTTALDVTVQAGILKLLRDLQRQTGISILFVTHDLGVAAEVADRMAVMYAGKLVEIGTAEELYHDPRHPYTWGLLGSMPGAAGGKMLNSIPGMPPELLRPPPGDAFAPRNPYALNIDFAQEPPLFRISDTHYAATWLLHPDAPKISPPIRVENGQILQNRNLQKETELL